MTAPTAPTETPPAPADGARERAQSFDGLLHAQVAPWLSGLSPVSLALATADWALHLATQPAQATRLAAEALQLAAQAVADATTQARLPRDASVRPDDLRFAADAWQRWPYPWIVRNYLAAERWWREATELRGMEPHNREIVGFFARHAP